MDQQSAVNDKDPKIEIEEFRVAGNTLLPTTQIGRLLTTYLGEEKKFSDIENARIALEESYHAADYPLVQVGIPEQDASKGVITLQVYENPVEEVTVTGGRYHSPKLVRQQLAGLAANNVLNSASLNNDLMSLNRATVDRQINPVLKPGRTPGTVEVELRMKDALPLHGSLEVNNDYTEDTSKLRASAGLSYDNLWQKNHTLALNYQTSPDETREVKVVSANYLAKQDDSQNVAVIYAVKSKSETATLGGLTVAGNGNIYGLRYIVPKVISVQEFHNLSIGMDYKDFEEAVTLEGADTGITPIDYLSFNLTYSITQNLGASSYQFGIGPVFGIRGLGNTEREFSDKRIFSKPNFFLLKGNGAWKSEIAWGSFYSMSVDWQLTDSEQISNEQFSAGGARSVRGYHQSQSFGDTGISGTLELHGPNVGSMIWQPMRMLDVYAFMDAAATRVINPLPGQQRSAELSSTGIGVNLQLLKSVYASISWARVYKETGSVESGDSRMHFSVKAQF